jgi:hypothetical protein
MRTYKNQNVVYSIVTFIFLVSLSSCLTSQKMDAFVGEQYGNQLPKQNKKLKSEIVVTTVLPPLKSNQISYTVKKTSQVIPLIVYWQFDYRHTCTLHPDIAVSNFSNSVNSMSGKLSQKLNGQKLELTIEQVPSAFAIADKGHIVLFIHWDRVFVDPDRKDLIVSYRILENDNATKVGKITVKSLEHSRNIRFAQSWKSATREYLANYNADISTMSKAFVTKLLEEL